MLHMCLKIGKANKGPFAIDLVDLSSNEVISSRMKRFHQSHCIKIPVTKQVKTSPLAEQLTKELVFGLRLTGMDRFRSGGSRRILETTLQKLKPVVVVFTKNNPTHPVLEMKFNTQSARAAFQKRSTNLVSSRKASCKRQSLIVSFKGLGYKDIIAPTIFDAKQCIGVCKFPLGKLSNPTQHSMIQQLVHSLYGNRVASSTCCAPKKLSPLIIMINDTFSGGIAIRSLENMVIAECGCI